MDIGTIAEAKLAHDLETLYLGIYQKKYGSSAYIEQQDRNVFNWLAASFPKPKTILIIEAYFRSTDPFISKKCHPVRLIKSEINQILPNVKEAAAPQGNRKILMKIPLSCDKCHTYFDWVGTAEELERTRLCAICTGK